MNTHTTTLRHTIPKCWINLPPASNKGHISKIHNPISTGRHDARTSNTNIIAICQWLYNAPKCSIYTRCTLDEKIYNEPEWFVCSTIYVPLNILEVSGIRDCYHKFTFSAHTQAHKHTVAACTRTNERTNEDIWKGNILCDLSVLLCGEKSFYCIFDLQVAKCGLGVVGAKADENAGCTRWSVCVRVRFFFPACILILHSIDLYSP